MMSIAAQVALPQLGENRRYTSRRPLQLETMLSDSGVEIVIHDISATGMLVETSSALSTGETLTIDLPGRGATTARVAWSSGRYVGCEFEVSIPAAAVSAALLRSAPLEPSPALGSGPDLATLNTLLAEAANADPIADDRYSLRTRGLVIAGFSGMAWALIGGLLLIN